MEEQGGAVVHKEAAHYMQVVQPGRRRVSGFEPGMACEPCRSTWSGAWTCRSDPNSFCCYKDAVVVHKVMCGDMDPWAVAYKPTDVTVSSFSFSF